MLEEGVVKKYVAGEILDTAYRLSLIPAKLIYHGTNFTGFFVSTVIVRSCSILILRGASCVSYGRPLGRAPILRTRWIQGHHPATIVP